MEIKNPILIGNEREGYVRIDLCDLRGHVKGEERQLFDCVADDWIPVFNCKVCHCGISSDGKRLYSIPCLEACI